MRVVFHNIRTLTEEDTVGNDHLVDAGGQRLRE